MRVETLADYAVSRWETVEDVPLPVALLVSGIMARHGFDCVEFRDENAYFWRESSTRPDGSVYAIRCFIPVLPYFDEWMRAR